MSRKVFKSEQIIEKLREAEVLLSKGHTVGEVSRKLDATEQAQHLVVGQFLQKVSISCHY